MRRSGSRSLAHLPTRRLSMAPAVKSGERTGDWMRQDRCYYLLAATMHAANAASAKVATEKRSIDRYCPPPREPARCCRCCGAIEGYIVQHRPRLCGLGRQQRHPFDSSWRRHDAVMPDMRRSFIHLRPDAVESQALVLSAALLLDGSASVVLETREEARISVH